MPGFLIEILHNILFIVTAIIFSIYLALVIYSAISLRKYLRKNSYVDYNSIITPSVVPSVSVIVPAFNESATIIDNIRTLLSLYYSDFEIVVINDGSTDDSMEKIIEAYELEKVNYYFDYRLGCERIKGVYKSMNRSFKKLMVVDKENGGKSDALNAGLNVVKNDLIVCIDADSIIEQDALLRMVKPFLEEKDRKVIGTGGVIRIANSCEIVSGKITKIHLPKKWLPRAQVMEYTRDFLIGRIAWSELDGLLLISGALGMFDREVVIQAGGYSTKTVGEDMELVVRIRRYMADQGIKYDVVYIPDPLCWTEVPSRLGDLARQRSRWTRGTMETLWTHRKLFFNRKYGNLGLLGYPYWLFFEWFAPILEFLGLIVFTFLVIMGKLNLSFFLLLLGFVYFFAVSLSIWSVLFEEITFHKYEKRRDVLKLMLTAFLEPLMFHPLVLGMTIKGNLDKLLKKSTWGKQVREGFNGDTEKKIRKLQVRRIAIGSAAAVAASVAIIWILIIRKPELAKVADNTVLNQQELKHETPPVSEIRNEDTLVVPVEESPPSQETIETTETNETVETVETPPVTPEIAGDNYCVIAGSFISQENAESHSTLLSNQGYATEILDKEGEYFRVALFSSAQKKEAVDFLAQVRNEPGMERSWILSPR